MDGQNNWDPNAGGQQPAVDPNQPAPVDPNAGQQGGWSNPAPVEPAQPAQQPDPNAGGGWNPEPSAPVNPEPAAPVGGQTWDQGQGGDQGTNQGGTV